MKKYFIVSDVHSFYAPLIKQLDKKGFDINNKEHILIICGDIFDRGNETIKMYEFIKSIPLDRRILIRGNHEYLFIDLARKEMPQNHDYSNGTVKTFVHLAGEDYSKIEKYPHYFDYDIFMWNKIRNDKKINEVIEWFYSDEWVDYYETKNYIFTHAFIPLHISRESHQTHMYLVNEIFLSYKDNWRESTKQEFENATWGCPWRIASYGLNKTGKTIVCGHWHTSDFFNNLKHLKRKIDVKKSNPIFISKKYKLIGLDACTGLTNKVNVLVLNEKEI